MEPIKIDDVKASESDQGLTLIVSIQGATIDLSGYVQKIGILAKYRVWCEDDLSAFADSKDTNIWECPPIAALCLALNRGWNEGKISPAEMTPIRLELIQSKIIEAINGIHPNHRPVRP